MRDKFFTQSTCDRCRGSLNDGRTMSMFNTQCICINCSTKEMLDPEYKKATDAEREQIKNGNYNYKGLRGDL